MLSDKAGFKVGVEHIKNYTSPFHVRCTLADINKDVLNYLFEKKSDYVIIDILDVRLPLLKKDNHIVTVTGTFKKNEEYLNGKFAFDTYERLLPSDITDEQWYENVDKLCGLLLRHYTPNQIILHKFYGVTEYANDTAVVSFKKTDIDAIHNYNLICTKLYHRLEDNIRGCHSIEFPNNVFALAKHKWGLTPLHYDDLYYEYGSRAIEIILHNFSEEKEKELLRELHSIYTEKFELVRKRLALYNLNQRFETAMEARNFAGEIALDFFGNEKLLKWLEHCRHSKIVVLKCKDLAGQILLKALSKYEIEVILSTPHFNFDCMNEESLEKCRQADIIISADVHGLEIKDNKGLNVIMLKDLLK